MKTTMRWMIVSMALLLAVGCEPAADNDSKAESKAGSQKEATAEKADEKAEANQKEKADKAEPTEEADEKSAQAAGDEKILGTDGTPSDQEPGTTRQYGAAFSLDTEPTDLASVVDSIDPSSKDNRATDTVKVSADIEKVCKKKGCWFTLQGEGVDRTVRVKMKDYGFFVPRNTKDGQAVLEGRLQARKMTEKEAKHYAKDEGKDPSTVSAEDLHVYEFTASAVQISL